MDEKTLQAAAQTFCLVPEIYAQAFKQAGADFPDELVAQIKKQPQQAMQMLQEDKELLQGVVTIYSQSHDQIDQVAAQAAQQAGLFKKGGKLEQLLVKAQDGTKTKVPEWISRNKYVSQEYGSDGTVQVEAAPTRKSLTVNQKKDPNSDFNVAMGDYLDNHLYVNADKNGVTSVYNGYGPFNDLHGADSAAVVNYVGALLEKAGIKPGFPMKNAADKK